MKKAALHLAEMILLPASGLAAVPEPPAEAAPTPGTAPQPGLHYGSVKEAVAEIAAGRMIIVTDDEDRENEGDLVMAAAHADAAAINFMTLHGRGLVCVPLLPERLAELDLPMMVQENTAPFATAFTVPVDARVGTTTGISAQDRAATIAALVDPATRPTDLVRPGHIFPLAARPGGVLERAGHTEAAIDLARLAGCGPAGVICEILAADGSMSRGADLADYARRHGLKVLSIAALRAELAGRLGPQGGDAHAAPPPEGLADRGLAASWLPTPWGRFRVTAFEEPGGPTHLALVWSPEGTDAMAPSSSDGPVLLRLHSECLTGEVFHSLRCDCGAQLEDALAMIAAAGGGMLLYLRQEGRGIGLANKIRAYALQDAGLDTVDANTALGLPADGRDYATAAGILRRLGVGRVRLISNNPDKGAGLRAHGVHVVERVPMRVALTRENRRYLQTKRDRMGHELSLPGMGAEEADHGQDL